MRDLGAGAAPLSPRRGAGAVTDPLEPPCAGDRAATRWLVGGAVRDRLLGRDDRRLRRGRIAGGGRSRPWPSARAGQAGGFAFELSEAFGAWRVVAHDRSWQLDLLPLDGDDDRGRPGSPRPDRQRDRRSRWAARRATSTRSAGSRTCARRRLRMVSARGVRARPAADAAPGPAGLRARLLGRAGDAGAGPGQRRRAGRGVAPERVFAELERVVCADRRAGRAGADGRDRRHRGRAARAGGAARRRAEPLSPPRRVRPHARGAGRDDRARARPRAGFRATTRRRSRGSARRAAGQRADPRPGAALRRPAARHRQAPDPRGDAEGRVTFMGHDEAGRRAGSGDPRPAAGQRAAARARGGAHPPPPAARLPRARDAAEPPRGLRLPARHARRSRSTSPCSASPTGWPPAATTPSGRSPGTSSWPASCWPRRWPGSRIRPGRRCAATSWPARSGSRPGRCSASCCASSRRPLQRRGGHARGGDRARAS